MKRLSDTDVEKNYKRYETYVGAKTTKTLIESFLSLTMKVLGVVVRVKDTDALQDELTNDYIITKELSAAADGLALRYGQWLTVANVVLITAKHIHFSAEQQIALVASFEVAENPQQLLNNYPIKYFCLLKPLADSLSQQPAETQPQPDSLSQQVTSKIPTTKPAKNPK